MPFEPGSPSSKGFIGQAGRIRLSPLEQAVTAARKGGNDPTANRANPSPAVAGKKPGTAGIPSKELPPGVTQDDVDAAVEKANAGDAVAIDWLKGLGILAAGTGAVVGGKVLYDAIKNRRTTPKSMGADHIARDAAVTNQASTTSKKSKAVTVPVTRVNEEIIQRAVPVEAVPDVPLIPKMPLQLPAPNEAAGILRRVIR